VDWHGRLRGTRCFHFHLTTASRACWGQLPQPRHVSLVSSLFWELDHMLKCKATCARPFHLGTCVIERKGVGCAVKCKIYYVCTQAKPLFSPYEAPESSSADCLGIQWFLDEYLILLVQVLRILCHLRSPNALWSLGSPRNPISHKHSALEK
jgi:hypothetical protein